MMDVRKMASMGQRAMRKQQSKAERIFWTTLGGRSRESMPNLIEAIHLGRAAANRLYDAMNDSGLRVKDAKCALACATKNGKVAVGIFQSENQDVSDLEMARDIINATPRLEPIGLTYCILDREKGELLMRVRPFQRTERAERLMDAVLREMERAMGELNKKGLAALRPD